ncbi:pantoate--beta-alanine ligase [Bacillus mesophilus]|uniref:Pantothenate synthetase n=1 Tax=Bacillus mesophilus TaxID=1808955 RepID=A0A6M0Q483_9BACI|nr:pantoate--beta-alanine ligase [Bacillus mesophilus]NEY71197.1 pantoate--beta-alanine ligase [Bacillus mesophilus]
MEIITSIQEMQKRIQQLKSDGKTIGFVPTMGFLHEGHLTLVEKAREKADLVVMSIFVNPLQFGPNEDFDRYPRDIERDEKLASEANVDLLFYPTVDEMYKSKHTFKVTVQDKVNILCGSKRPGHFDGVATVLIKLFNIVQPTYAFFGMKDAQQVAIVSSLITEFNFPIELVPVETVREVDGLAKSSRNVYLTESERKEAVAISQSLKLAGRLIQGGEENPLEIQKRMETHIMEHTSAEIDYIEIYSFPDLKTVTSISGLVLIAVAIRFTNVRLIDNMTFDV